jgi:hypothetical protein
MKFERIWNITEMENWDEDYFNMEVQAYIEIYKRGLLFETLRKQRSSIRDGRS